VGQNRISGELTVPDKGGYIDLRKNANIPGKTKAFGE